MCEREGPGPDYHDPLDHGYACNCDDCAECEDDYGDCDECGTRVDREDWDSETDLCKECRHKLCYECAAPATCQRGESNFCAECNAEMNWREEQRAGKAGAD